MNPCPHPAFGPVPGDGETRLVPGKDGLALGEYRGGAGWVIVCGLCSLEATVDEATASRMVAVIRMGRGKALDLVRAEARAILEERGEPVCFKVPE